MKNHIALLLIFLSATSFAETKNDKVSPLWKEWYLVTNNGKAQGYYKEEAELRTTENQLAINQRWMEHEEELTETFIGSVAKNDDNFTPVAFYVERKTPSKEISTDGRVKEGQILIQVKSGNNVQKFNEKLEKGIIWSNFLASLLAKSKTNTISFFAVLEDAKDGNFSSQIGKAVRELQKKNFQKDSCRKYHLSFQQIESEWWIANNGKLCEVSFPSGGVKISLSTEEAAIAAFQGKPKK